MAKKQKQNDVLVLVILDESGSMENKKNDVIGGFNGFLKKQKEDKSPCRMMITKFNTVCTQMEWENGKNDRAKVVPLDKILNLDETNYIPGGGTALFDAIAGTVKYADLEKTKKEKVLCVIVTDGEENSSRETMFDQVKSLIEARTKQGWTFLYIGEEPQRWAERTGMSIGQTLSYNHTFVVANYKNMVYATSSFRANPDQDTTNLMQEANAQREKDEVDSKTTLSN